MELISRRSAAKQSRNFDPVSFTVVPPRRFEDLRVGDVFRAPSRTVTDAHAAAFQTVSADNHPIHYDVEYARRHGHTAPVVHGLQVFAFTAPGATLFPQYIGDVFVAFLSASCKFLKEVNAGDTLYPALEIIALAPQGATGIVTTHATVHNQRGELVLDGEHQYALENITRGCKVASISRSLDSPELQPSQTSLRGHWLTRRKDLGKSSGIFCLVGDD
jgi:acyl dehydratase